MNLWIHLSLTLNAVLLGVAVWWGGAGPRSETLPEPSRCLTNHGWRAKPKSMPTPSEAESTPQVVELHEPFHWAQLESTDYRIYLENLRAIGCPEPTVRDILIADVNDLFSRRVKALVDQVSGRFWELIVRQDDLEKMAKEKHVQLEALGDERDAVFTALFGEANPRSAEHIERNAADRREQWERITDFLPEAKRVRFVAANDELEQAWGEVQRTPGLTAVERQARRKELDAAHAQALSEWLSPDEYHEVCLRQSPAASVRERLVGLDWSEEQVRAVANIQLASEQARAALSQKDAEFKSRLAQLQQQSEAQTRELLGPDGYAALQRATDGRYSPIYRVTQRLELPDATAAQAYDIRRQAEDAARHLRENPSLSAEDRQARLQTVSAVTRQSLSAALGPKGFAAYETMDGGWMQQMSAPRP